MTHARSSLPMLKTNARSSLPRYSRLMLSRTVTQDHVTFVTQISCALVTADNQDSSALATSDSYSRLTHARHFRPLPRLMRARHFRYFVLRARHFRATQDSLPIATQDSPTLVTSIPLSRLMHARSSLPILETNARSSLPSRYPRLTRTCSSLPLLETLARSSLALLKTLARSSLPRYSRLMHSRPVAQDHVTSLLKTHARSSLLILKTHPRAPLPITTQDSCTLVISVPLPRLMRARHFRSVTQDSCARHFRYPRLLHARHFRYSRLMRARHLRYSRLLRARHFLTTQDSPVLVTFDTEDQARSSIPHYSRLMHPRPVSQDHVTFVTYSRLMRARHSRCSRLMRARHLRYSRLLRARHFLTTQDSPVLVTFDTEDQARSSIPHYSRLMHPRPVSQDHVTFVTYSRLMRARHSRCSRPMRARHSRYPGLMLSRPVTQDHVTFVIEDPSALVASDTQDS